MKAINKIYEGLSSQEKAALAFHYIITGDSAEVDKIDATVEHYHYRMPDGKYRRRLYCYMAFESMVSIEYWRLQARLNMLMAGVMAVESEDDNNELPDLIMKAVIKGEGRLLALEDALDTICSEHGLDSGAVRLFAGIEPSAPTFPESVMDTQQRDVYIKMWQDILTA